MISEGGQLPGANLKNVLVPPSSGGETSGGSIFSRTLMVTPSQIPCPCAGPFSSAPWSWAGIVFMDKASLRNPQPSTHMEDSALTLVPQIVINPHRSLSTSLPSSTRLYPLVYYTIYLLNLKRKQTVRQAVYMQKKFNFCLSFCLGQENTFWNTQMQVFFN